MIVLPDKKLVIITPPHTASGNVHKELCNRKKYNSYWVMGETRVRGLVDHHYYIVSGAWKEFTVALVIRHPLDRLIGLYLHYEWQSQQSGLDYVDWHEYVRLLTLDPRQLLTYIHYTNIADIIGSTDIHYYIRYDNLKDDLEYLLDTRLDLGEEYHSAVDIKEYYSNQDTLLSAILWALPDLHRFHYDPLVIPQISGEVTVLDNNNVGF